MEETTSQIEKAFRLLENANSSLKAAQTILAKLAPESLRRVDVQLDTSEAKIYDSGNMQVVEGTFNGQNMIGPNEKIYPVPANYASKSKMIEGDRLKLTIMPNGSFIYKQISPIERKHVKGTLINEDGQYRVLADGKSYRVLLASVTYYKGNAGDEVTLIIPEAKSDSIWGAIEAILPHGS